MTVTREMKQLTQHNFNALHVYCRLVDLGLNRKAARRVGEIVDTLTRVLYR